MNILITRSQKENLEFFQKIQKLKIKLYQIALINYSLLKFNYKELYNFSNIILSSKFSTSIFLRDRSLKDKNFWVVGEQSKEMLLNKGYAKVIQFPNVKSLFAQITRESASNYIYISGSNYTLRPPYGISHRVIYDAFYRNYLSKEERQILHNISLSKILLFSTHSARNFFFYHKNITFYPTL